MITVLEWMKLQYPTAYKNIIKIDNEGATGRAQAIQCGLHVGASDWFLRHPTLKYYGAFLEVKPDGWKLTPSKKANFDTQSRFIFDSRCLGYAADLRIGVDACIDFFDNYLKGKTIDYQLTV